MEKEYIQINKNHTVELDNSFKSKGSEVVFMHTTKSHIYEVYNDVCACCGHIKRQVAKELLKD